MAAVAAFPQILGSLGVFLYGMKVLSEGIQKIAGQRMRYVMATMTKNRVGGRFAEIESGRQTLGDSGRELLFRTEEAVPAHPEAQAPGRSDEAGEHGVGASDGVLSFGMAHLVDGELLPGEPELADQGSQRDRQIIVLH